MPDPAPNNAPESDDEGQQQQQQPNQQPPEFEAITSQEEFDRRISARLRRETAKYRDYDTLKSKAEQYDALAAASRTDQERVAAEAQEQGFNAAMSKAVPRLVRAEFRAAAAGRLTGDQLDALVEDLDLTKYVDDDGEPDLAKIARKVDAVAPKAPAPSFGQGNRGAPPKGQNMNDLIRKQAGFGT